MGSGAQGCCKAREGQEGIEPAEWRLSPAQTVLRSTLLSPTPPPSPSRPNAPWRTPPNPATRPTAARVLTAEALPGARSRCFWDLEGTPHSAGHAPGTRPQPLPPRCPAPGQHGPGLFCHTPTSGLWRVPGGSAFKTYPSSGPCSPRPLSDPPSSLPR